MAQKKEQKELLTALKKERDLAVKFRKKIGWDERCERSYWYYQYGLNEDLSDQQLRKRDKRKANYVFSNIESMIPKMFDRIPSFQVLGRAAEDHEKAPLVEEILRYKLERLDLEEKMEDVVRDQLVRSAGYLKITWDSKVIEGEDKEVEAIETDDIKLEVVIPKNIWITAGDYRLEDAKGLFEKIAISKEDAKSRFGKELEVDHFLIDSEDQNELQGRVGIWEFNGRIKGKKRRVWFTDKEILSETDFYEHGRLPYIELPNYRMSDEFYSWSEVYQMEPLQDELIEIDNQASEFRKRAINPKKIVKKGVIDEINMARLKDPRVNVVEVADIGGVHWESPSLIGRDIYEMRAIKKEDISLMTGQNELSRGGTEETVRTATGQQILFDAAQGRVRQKVRTMERALKELLIQVQGLLAQFQDKEEQVRITEDQQNPFAEYAKEDIQGNFDFMIDIVDTMPILRAKRGQLALQAYELFKEDPDIDQLALKKKTIKLAFQDIGAEVLVKEPEEQAPEELQLPPEAQQQAGPGGLSKTEIQQFGQNIPQSAGQEQFSPQEQPAAFL